MRRAAFEIMSLVNYYRAQRVGSFCTGLLLWESCCVPSLIHNCSTWVGMEREEEKVLNQCQDLFLKLLWATRGAPGRPEGGFGDPEFADPQCNICPQFCSSPSLEFNCSLLLFILEFETDCEKAEVAAWKNCPSGPSEGAVQVTDVGQFFQAASRLFHS